MGINIYFERDPKLTPDATSCPNPPSLTQIKCVFWGGPVTTSNTNNPGRTWASFSVVVAGSNGYVNQNIAAPSGYTDALYLGNAAINAPYDSQGFDTFMGSKVFTLGPFNASLCAEACGAQNVYNLANPPTDGSPVQTCQFFNTYLLYLNDTVGLGQYCAMYSETWTSKYATKVEQWRGNDRYTVQYSYAFSNVTVPGVANKNAAVYQASKDISASTLQPFCSTFLGYNDLNAYVTRTTTKVPVVTVTATTTIKTKAKRSVISSSASSGFKTPDALTKYPGSVVSSACQMLVTSVPKTATITVATVTVSGATSKTTTTKTIITTTR